MNEVARHERDCAYLINLFFFYSENYASAQESTKNVSRVEKATLAGGCFWCLESAMEKLSGVIEAISGYTEVISKTLLMKKYARELPDTTKPLRLPLTRKKLPTRKFWMLLEKHKSHGPLGAIQRQRSTIPYCNLLPQ